MWHEKIPHSRGFAPVFSPFRNSGDTFWKTHTFAPSEVHTSRHISQHICYTANFLIVFKSELTINDIFANFLKNTLLRRVRPSRVPWSSYVTWENPTFTRFCPSFLLFAIPATHFGKHTLLHRVRSTHRHISQHNISIHVKPSTNINKPVKA